MTMNPLSVCHSKSVISIGVLALVLFSAVMTVLTSNGIRKEELQQQLRGDNHQQHDSKQYSLRSAQLHKDDHHDQEQILMEEMDVILNQTNQIFITMPAKAAGSTMKHFTQKCMNMTVPENFLNENKEIENVFTTHYELPSIIASHLYSGSPFINLVKGATRETLIIYIHREELSRLRSGIQHVLMSRVCVHHVSGTQLMEKYHFDVEINSNKCTIHERHLITLLIKKKAQEVGFGASEILTCGYFDAIAQNTPSNLMFVHYKQADKLQKMLAKYHCPHLVKDLPFVVNVADKKNVELFVQLQSNTSRNVTFTEWFDKKQNLILWALNSKHNMDCQSKIVDMEDHLFSCPDQAVTLFQDEFQCVSLSNGAD